MLSDKQVKEIREHLSKAQNPLFFFDNDPDGLCSFLLLRRYADRGKGVAIRSFPELNLSYFRKVQELRADYIFILDKPTVSEEFLKEAEKYNIPVVWIDHHAVEQEIPKGVFYYNPVHDAKSSKKQEKNDQPVTYLCYQVSKVKEDIWIAVVGCIADGFFPEFYEEFEKKYPELSTASREAFDIYYRGQVGKIAKILSFSLKDTTTNVVGMLKYLLTAKSPYDILDENSKNYSMHRRYTQINTRYMRLMRKVRENTDKSKKILFFQYGGDLSISSDLSNELSYKFPDKVVVVAYLSGVKANISVRGKKVREAVLESIKELEDASGGGHEDAVGAKVRIEDLVKFKENLTKNIK